MPFVRTILGDIAAGELGVCYAHEHVIIDHGCATEQNPEFLLNDIEKITTELLDFRRAGGRAMVDTMPSGCGRNVRLLAEVSRRSAVHIICPTGLHLGKYYPPQHWSQALRDDPVTVEALAERFGREVTYGMDGTPYRAGIIKVAGSLDRLSARERAAFIAAAITQRRSGCPIITHTEQGTAALEQVDLLRQHGADLSHVVLSHLDRRPDAAYHRAVLSTGVKIEYDSAFRWPPGPNHTLDLLAELLPAFPDQILLGMDAARSRYWKSYGGAPGLAFLLESFADQMRARGIGQDLIDRVFVNNPGQTYAFSKTGDEAEA